MKYLPYKLSSCDSSFLIWCSRMRPVSMLREQQFKQYFDVKASLWNWPSFWRYAVSGKGCFAGISGLAVFRSPWGNKNKVLIQADFIVNNDWGTAVYLLCLETNNVVKHCFCQHLRHCWSFHVYYFHFSGKDTFQRNFIFAFLWNLLFLNYKAERLRFLEEMRICFICYAFYILAKILFCFYGSEGEVHFSDKAPPLLLQVKDYYCVIFWLWDDHLVVTNQS